MRVAVCWATMALVGLSSGLIRAQELLVNGGLELSPGDFGGANSVPSGWSLVEGGTLPHSPSLSTAEPANFAHLLLEGEWMMWYQPYQASFFNGGGFALLTQSVPGTSGLKYTISGWALFEKHYAGGVERLNLPGTGAPFDDGPASPTESYFALHFLDADGNVLVNSVELELHDAGQQNDSGWQQHSLSAIAPSGTVSVRVGSSMLGGVWNQGADPQSYFVDSFSLTAVPEPSVGTPIVLGLCVGLFRPRLTR